MLIPFFVSCSVFEGDDDMTDEDIIVYEGDELKLAQYRWQRYDSTGHAEGGLIQYFFSYDDNFNLIEIVRNSPFGPLHKLDFSYQEDELLEVRLYKVISTIDEIYLWDTLLVESNTWTSKNDLSDGNYMAAHFNEERVTEIDSVKQSGIEVLRRFSYDNEGNMIDVEHDFWGEVKFDYSESVKNPFLPVSILTPFGINFLPFFPFGDLASSENLPKCWDFGVNWGELDWILDEKGRPTELIKSSSLNNGHLKLTLVYIN